MINMSNYIHEYFKVAKLANGELAAINCSDKISDSVFKRLLENQRMNPVSIYTTKQITEEVKKGLEYFEFLVNGD